MTTNDWIAVITVLLSVVSVILSGVFGVRTTRLSHRLEEERDRRIEEESAIKAAERVYEPLAQAAAELQSRIFNIVETGWVPLKTLRRSEGSAGFLFFSTEQRAIGELMCTWESTPTSGGRFASVMGYAAFERRYYADAEFAKWFSSVQAGMVLVASGDVKRLVEIQRALVALIDKLDPHRRYTAGYELQAIDLNDVSP
jgi:hypothetical protein